MVRSSEKKDFSSFFMAAIHGGLCKKLIMNTL